MTDISLPHDKISLTRISELGREREQKLEDERGREQAQLEQTRATVLRRLQDGHLVEIEKAYDLSDGATISCRIGASDTEYCWGGDPARPRRYLLVINVPGHKDVYRQFHLQDGDYVRSGQWCVDYAGWNPHYTLQDALVRARESWLRDETSDAQSECGISRKTKERIMTGRNVPFDPSTPCDNCGAMGAFDFMGDCLCEKCSSTDGDDIMFDQRYIRRLWCRLIGHDIWWPSRLDRWAGEKEYCKRCWYDGYDMPYLEDDITLPLLLNRWYCWMEKQEWKWWYAIDDWIVDKLKGKLPSWWSC